MKADTAVSLFGFRNLSLDADLKRIEQELDIEFKSKRQAPEERGYIQQFPADVRAKARIMAGHYETFYALENSIREMISSRLKEEVGQAWWDTAVPENVRQNAEKNRSRELRTGVTVRSTEMIDYTNFGELGEIIKTNWAIFNDTFKDVGAVEAILARLNTLRANIAHCSFMAEDEVARLDLSVKDWFRQMG